MKYLLQKHDLLVRIMKISIQQIGLLLLVVSISNATSLSGQNILEKQISLTVENKPLKTVLTQIEKEANVRFMYSSKVVGAERKVDLTVSRHPLGAVLHTLFEPLGVGYRISGQHIILSCTRNFSTLPGLNTPIINRINTHVERRITGTVR